MSILTEYDFNKQFPKLNEHLSCLFLQYFSAFVHVSILCAMGKGLRTVRRHLTIAHKNFDHTKYNVEGFRP